MTIDTSAIDLLSGGGATAKFASVGDTHKGTIISATSQQQTEFGTGKPKTWDNGDPMMEVVIAIQTDEIDHDLPNDDGVRRLYVKGEMQKAVREALRKAGSKIEVGGTLAVKYTGDGTSSKPAYNPPKLYAAKYEPPAPGTVAAGDTDDGDFF